jgi:transposase
MAMASPRLRLSGTNAGPVTQEEQQLLELRAGLVRARALQGTEAAMIRERLVRAGRKDPIGLIRGNDAFDRMTGEIDTLLARIDSRLAEIDASRVGVIDVDPNVADLLRRS